MASIKVKFRPSAISGREGTIYYQIIHNRKVRQITTEYKILSSEWNNKTGKIVVNKTSERTPLTESIRRDVMRDVERIVRIIRTNELRDPDYTADYIIDEFNRIKEEHTFAHYMEVIIDNLKRNGKIRTAETYVSALNNFRKFLTDASWFHKCASYPNDIMLDCITAELIESYESWQKMRGVVPNTISFYMRIIRAMYNRAVGEDMIDDTRPFRKVYTGIDKTVKRALPIKIIKKIKNLDLSMSPTVDYARDMFLLSFYLRGMSFIDMAYLRKKDLHNGTLVYRRRKTGQRLSVKWTKEMESILDKYPRNPTCYLLPILTKSVSGESLSGERSRYRNKGYIINRNLKKVMSMIGIETPLTLYTARHSWASAAKANGIPLNVISEGMGHDSETITRIYLASLESSVVDKANSIIIQSLR